MTFKKLELQKIDDLVFEKKRDENFALISILGETCELQFSQGVFTFKKQITTIHEIDADTITRLAKGLSIMSGGLGCVHSHLTCTDYSIQAVMELDEDQISNVKIHDRIIKFMCLALCVDEVFKSHSI